jgi:Right handed beta helix region
VLRVGKARQFKTVRAAVRASRNGDRIEIDAGVYKGDVCQIKRNNLHIIGVGGMAHLDADGKNEGGKGTFVIDGDNTVIENIEFSGAKVRDENGAGIRHQGGDITIRNCYFHDNQNGILGGHGKANMVVEYCEFANNGYGKGYTHNMYIGRCASFTLRFSYSHHAKVGHNVKSRAKKNFILYNRIMDEADGRASRAIDLPDCGLAVIMGNIIQQGRRTENSAAVTYGAEKRVNPDHRVYFINNTVVNDRGRGTFFEARCSGGLVANNLFVGNGRVRSGKAESRNNLVTANSAVLTDRTKYDYRLSTRAGEVVNKAADCGEVDGFKLTPIAQYVHKARGEERSNVGDARDIGAYEFGMQARIKYQPGMELLAARPAPRPKPKPRPLAKPKPKAKPAPPPKPIKRTPEQICRGYYSSARNYKNVGMKKDARRCLNIIINKYSDTAWASKARAMLAEL